jgi:hypothetical protein
MGLSIDNIVLVNFHRIEQGRIEVCSISLWQLSNHNQRPRAQTSTHLSRRQSHYSVNNHLLLCCLKYRLEIPPGFVAALIRWFLVLETALDDVLVPN